MGVLGRLWDPLTVSLSGVDAERLLELWRWLIPDGLHPWFATALGDLFLHGSDGQVWWLEVGSGELQAVASNEAQFRQLLADPNNASLWFGRELVDALRKSGLSLRQGECYSYWVLPILGGEYKPDNFRVYDVLTHFQVWGPIHEKINDLPDGAEVEFVVD